MTEPRGRAEAWAESAPPPAGVSTSDVPAEALLRLPDRLDEPGLLVGWSLEAVRPRLPLGFTSGNPTQSVPSGFLDPILMEKEGHLLTVAPTGAGKGVSCIVPALLRYRGPVIVIDPKGENVAVTARRRRELGQTVVVLDPIGITGEPTGSLNPLELLDPELATTVDEAVAIASTLIDAKADPKDRFWYDRATHFISGAILHAVSDFPKEEQNLTTVRRILEEVGAGSEERLTAMRESRHPEVRAIVTSMAGGEAAVTTASIIAVAQDGLDVLRGPLVQDAVRSSSFDIADVTKGEPLSIYIVLPPHMLESHGRLLRLWVATLMRAHTRRRGAAPLATLFLIDEAAQLGTLPALRQAVTLLRGYGVRTWSFWQDMSQLKLLYPADWQTMVNNCEVLQCFGAFNAMAAADIAEVTGFGASSALDLDPDEMVLQIRGDQAVVARLPNYRTDPAFAGLFDANPYYRPETELAQRPTPRVRLYDRRPADADGPLRVEPATWSTSRPDDPDTSDPFLDRLLGTWATEGPVDPPPAG